MRSLTSDMIECLLELPAITELSIPLAALRVPSMELVLVSRWSWKSGTTRPAVAYDYLIGVCELTDLL